MELGVQIYTVREHTKDEAGLERAFERIRGIGYRTLEGAGLSRFPAERVGELAQKHDLRIAADHVGIKDLMDDIDVVIERHRLWKTEALIIPALDEATYLNAEGLAKLADLLPEIAARLKEAGMQLGYHNHHFEFKHIDGRTVLEALYKIVPAEVLKAELDVHWVVRGGGDPVSWIRRLAGRQPTIHLKDFAVGLDSEARHAPVGEGNMNFPAIIQAAREAGVRYGFVEQDDAYGEDPFDCLERSYRHLNTTFGLQ
ncbi:MAG: sugar phosphate isomerase/epimerase family protein [Verrucomicrobiota bacterium]